MASQIRIFMLQNITSKITLAILRKTHKLHKGPKAFLKLYLDSHNSYDLNSHEIFTDFLISNFWPHCGLILCFCQL